MTPGHPIGAVPGDQGVTFTVWAPRTSRVTLVVEGRDEPWALEPLAGGYHGITVAQLGPGTRYRFSLDGSPALPDPASRSQPDGVGGPSEVVDFGGHPWGDGAYRPRPLCEHIISEWHIGSLTPAGTFDAAIEVLDDLCLAGISAVEIMPVGQFPGARNWGYDGVFPFAVQNTYGGPAGLQRLVDACHQRGVTVFLDVVYNHLGPEGNILDAYGPYFTDRYTTPWGPAVNLDGAHSDDVRSYFVQNACQWLHDFHLDGLRLDAVHEFVDRTATPFLVDLSRSVEALGTKLGRPLVLIAESADNDPRLTAAIETGGLGMQAQWSDDFHHALHSVLTGESAGYYMDYGKVDQLATALADEFVYAGDYSAFRERRHGAPAADLPTDRFLHYAQNHDQIGNRSDSERLSTLVSFERQRMAAAVVLLSPGVPLLFMGEEYGEVAPFPYFVDHGDPALIDAVRRGRAREFPDAEAGGARYDPADSATMALAVPDPSLRQKADHAQLLALHRRLIEIRRDNPALQESVRSGTSASAAGPLLTLVRRRPPQSVVAVFNLSDAAATSTLPDLHGTQPWTMLIHSDQEEFGRPGPGGPDLVVPGTPVSLPPWGFCAYQCSMEDLS